MVIEVERESAEPVYGQIARQIPGHHGVIETAGQSKTARGASNTGDLRPKPARKAGEQWGKMRDKEREDVLQALKQKFPDRYRELLEQYNKALAEGKRVTEPGEEAGEGR